MIETKELLERLGCLPTVTGYQEHTVKQAIEFVIEHSPFDNRPALIKTLRESGWMSNDENQIDLYRKTDCGCGMTERIWETGNGLAIEMHKFAYSFPIQYVTPTLLKTLGVMK